MARDVPAAVGDGGGLGIGGGRAGLGGFGFVRSGILLGQILFREDTSEGADALEILDGAAVEAFGLGLITKEELPVRFAAELREAGGHPVTVILAGRDLQSISELGVLEDSRVAGNLQSFLKAHGDESRLDAVSAEEGMPREGDALDGEKLFGVDGLVEGDEVGLEVGDGVGILGADGGEGGGVEEMVAGVRSFRWVARVGGHAMLLVQL